MALGRRHGLVGVTASFSLLLGCLLAAQLPSDEDRLKAAVVHRFPEFVEWPVRSLDGRDAVEVCVAAPATFSSALRELLSDDVVSGRPVTLRAITETSDVDSCHVLVTSGTSVAARQLLRRTRAKPILTIGDDARFLDDGGVVQLRVVDRRVRFDINASAAREADLKVSSQLLSLAQNVRGAPQ